MNFLRPGRCITYFIGWIALSLSGHANAQGTVEFLNSTLSLIKVRYCGPSNISVIATAPIGTHVGIYVGDTPFNMRLVTPTVVMQSPGIFSGGVVYPIAGTQEGQTVWMKVAAWDAGDSPQGASLIGYSETLQVTLGPTAGPGTVIFQSAAGTATNRFHPFIFGPLGPCANDPYIVASTPRSHVYAHPSFETTVTFTIRNTTASLQPPLLPAQVDFATVSGTALAGRDFVPTNGTIYFPTSVSSTAITVRIPPRPLPSEDRSFSFRLSNQSPQTAFIFGDPTVWITQPTISSTRRNSSAAALVIPTYFGWNYGLESSADLLNWSPVADMTTATTNGITTFYDPSPNGGWQFYRVRIDPIPGGM